MKAILGGTIICLGSMALVFGLVGLQLPFLGWLDALGPRWAYLCKFAFIATGMWIMLRDRVYAEPDVTEEEGRRAWTPVMIAVTVIIGIIGFITVSEMTDVRLEKLVKRRPPAAAWAATPVTVWPNFVLLQKARFAHHTPLDGGCACLVRLPTGEIVALTAGHLLGKDCGVKPGFVQNGSEALDRGELSTLDKEISSWKLFLPESEAEGINVVGLYGNARKLDEQCDQVLLRVAPDKAGYPATPLDVRMTPPVVSEKLWVITYAKDDDGSVRQIVHAAHRVPGLKFTCVLETPADVDAYSGAPIVDKDGLLVGIVTGGTIFDRPTRSGEVHGFSGHCASELLSLLKPIVATHGVAELGPLKVVAKIPVVDGDEDERPSIKNTAI